MSPSVPQIYQRRHPQSTVLYQVVQNYFEDWLANYFLKHNEVLPRFVENEFRDYFKCGILCYGFARARCVCGADFVIAFSCKRRGVCPSCNTKHMIATATHIVEEVLPKLPVRQWVLSLPKWNRYYLARDPSLASQVLRIFIDEIQKQLKSLSPKNIINAKIGAISFIQCFGSSLNLHLMARVSSGGYTFDNNFFGDNFLAYALNFKPSEFPWKKLESSVAPIYFLENSYSYMPDAMWQNDNDF